MSQHRPVAPFQPMEIPNEMLSEIFSLASPPAWPSALKSVTAIMSVCKRWRDVAISTQILWSSISVDFHEVPLSIERVQTWLERSGSQALSISITSSGWSGRYRTNQSVILDLLINQKSRWQRLYICIEPEDLDQLNTITTSLPILRELSIQQHRGDTCIQFCHTAPALESLLVDRISWSTFWLLPWKLPWNQLRKYSISGLPIDGCLWVMDQCIDLVECSLETELENRELEIYRPLSENTPIHRHLRSLTMEVSTQLHIPALLNRATAPSLIELYLVLIGPSDSFSDWDPSPREAIPISLASFFTRSSCPLKYLRLDGILLPASELIECLEHIPGLVELYAREWDMNDDDHPVVALFTPELFHAMTGSHCSVMTSQLGGSLMVPRLKKLELLGRFTMDQKIIMDMVNFRKSGVDENLRDSAMDAINIHEGYIGFQCAPIEPDEVVRRWDDL